MNPTVKLFLRVKQSVTECAISSILSLVSHENSAYSTNQADLFDYILNRQNQVKHHTIYHEPRFTKLWYSAVSILERLPFLWMLFNETHLRTGMCKLSNYCSIINFLPLHLKHFLYLPTRQDCHFCTLLRLALNKTFSKHFLSSMKILAID